MSRRGEQAGGTFGAAAGPHTQWEFVLGYAGPAFALPPNPGEPMSDILFDVEHHVATITLNRADRLNAISGPMLASLAEKLIEYDQSQEVRVVVLTGAGRGFCAGLDLKDTASRSGDGSKPDSITGGGGMPKEKSLEPLPASSNNDDGEEEIFRNGIDRNLVYFVFIIFRINFGRLIFIIVVAGIFN